MTKTALGPDEPDWRWVQHVAAPPWRGLGSLWFIVVPWLWATWTVWRALALVCAVTVLVWLMT